MGGNHQISKNITIYHGTSESNFKPRFGAGRDYHDYGNGFYSTEDIESAKEWASQGQLNSGYVYEYELDISDLNILNLDAPKMLAWVSILMSHRRSKRIRGAALERCNKMIERYGIDVGGYDLIRGFRADDSYFQFTLDFMTDTITLENLMKSLVAGNLGFQVCVKSEKAYQRLGKCTNIIHVSGADYERYHNRYLTKDFEARKLAKDYSDEPQVGQLLSDILKEDAG
ncbi:MAG: DUF3990 domain-containing protein [Deltaproteobacteria bacterium]|jgi:hypothetical protein|nr:DUF3990 domain-containing protein [Deltaproteobacteria bacterium]